MPSRSASVAGRICMRVTIPQEARVMNEVRVEVGDWIAVIKPPTSNFKSQPVAVMLAPDHTGDTRMPSIDMPLEKLREYQPPLYREPDFEEYWRTTVGEAVKQPLNAELIPYELSARGVQCYAVRY